MAKEIPEHKDILGRIINVGDYVAYPYSNELKLGKVAKIHPKMISIDTNSKWNSITNKYPRDLVKLDGPDLTTYLLKR